MLWSVERTRGGAVGKGIWSICWFRDRDLVSNRLAIWLL
jgi:hypothetical protein